jgi:3-isopropylmalate/(R)-2-methylmalate dehydratase small subunit
MKMPKRAWKFGSNVDTDVIIPGQYLNISDPQELAKYCMEGIDKDFAGKVKPGDIIVAGENFGCGSSREHAPLAIKASGVSCVITKSVARIFFRNSINIALPIIECGEASDDIQEGDLIEIDHKSGLIKNLSTQNTYRFDAFPSFIEDIISSGGLIPYTSKRISEKNK